MLLGLQLRSYAPGEYGNEVDTTLAVVRACEEAGLDSVWAFDHVMIGDMVDLEKELPILEAFVTLGAMAATTENIRIGQLVTSVPFRNPALLAKMCATLDVASHGRTIVGLGAGWHEPEFNAYGWPFPSVSDRMEMLEEAVQIIDLMLTEHAASFQGKHYSIDAASNLPRPVQQPRPPIMIGGSGRRVTLRLVAQYADMCNLFGPPNDVTQGFDALRKHCADVGRPFDAITRTNFAVILIGRDEAEVERKKEQFPEDANARSAIVGTPEEVAAGLQAYADVGSQYVTFHMPDAVDLEPLQLLGETVVPRIASI